MNEGCAKANQLHLLDIDHVESACTEIGSDDVSKARVFIDNNVMCSREIATVRVLEVRSHSFERCPSCCCCRCYCH
jgi:hypothetical protein